MNSDNRYIKQQGRFRKRIAASAEQELNIIKSGGIWYKKAEIHEVSVNIIGTTAILLNRITLLAVVGENEVTNLFEVTEVYVKEGNSWKLGSLSFTRLLAPPGPAPESH